MRWRAHLIPWFSALCGVVLYLYALPLATVSKPRHEQLFALPANLLRVVTGQFKEISADISFLNALTWLGGTRPHPETGRYQPYQYEWLYQTLKNSTTLDPYFLDPYHLLNSALMWDRYKEAEVNMMIAAGADTRTWDYILPFFAGFNYYYFLNDGNQSFRYLKLASHRSGGHPFYDSLAARVAYKANKTDLAIAYLEEQVRQATLEGQKFRQESLENRLKTLKEIRQIEIAVETYQKLFSRPPSNIDELTTLKLLATIPKEPNGGSYYLDPDGRVRSTKDLK